MLETFIQLLHIAALLFFLKFIANIFDETPRSIVGTVFVGEMKSLIGRERSMGAYNMGAIILGFVFGVMIIAVIEFDKGFRFLVQLVGKEQVQVFEKTASFETMFYVLFAFLFLSVVAVLLDKWRRR
jgi:hypothetical protein